MKLLKYVADEISRFVCLEENEEMEALVVHWMEGDGIGANTDPEFNFLTSSALEIFEGLRDRLQAIGIELEIREHSLTTEKRLRISKPGGIKEYHDRVSRDVLEGGGFAVKFPGRTLKDAQIIEFLGAFEPVTFPVPANEEVERLTSAQFFPSDLLGEFGIQSLSSDQKQILAMIWNRRRDLEPAQILEVYKGWRSSPNALLRKGLGLTAIYRPLDPVEGGYQKPDLKPFEVFEPEGISWKDMKSFVETGSGEFIRQLRQSDLRMYAAELVGHASSTGKPILLTSKDTISSFDAVFTDHIKKVAQAAGVEVEEQLFDSFLDLVARGAVGDRIVSCLPVNAKMLEGVKNMSRDDVADIDPGSIPSRHFIRVPVGSGYGEKSFEKDGYIAETYSLPEKELVASARVAADLALKETDSEKRSVTILMATGDNPMDEYLAGICIGVMKEKGCPYEVITIGDNMANLLRDPSKGSVTDMGDNVGGDFMSDFNAGLTLAGLPNGKSLGIPPSVDQAIDDLGKALVTLCNPAAGTAEPLAKSPEASRQVLSASILKSIALGLQMHPFFGDDKIELREKVQRIGTLLSQSVSIVTAEHMSRETHETFAADVLKTFEVLEEQDFV